jgi:hypothetical protein
VATGTFPVDQSKENDMSTEPFVVGQHLRHARRGEVVFEGMDDADPSGATAWVRFDDGESGMVSTHLLAPAAGLDGDK